MLAGENSADASGIATASCAGTMVSGRPQHTALSSLTSVAWPQQACGVTCRSAFSWLRCFCQVAMHRSEQAVFAACCQPRASSGSTDDPLMPRAGGTLLTPAADSAVELPTVDRLHRSAWTVLDHADCHFAGQLHTKPAASVPIGAYVRWISGVNKILPHFGRCSCPERLCRHTGERPVIYLSMICVINQHCASQYW